MFDFDDSRGDNRPLDLRNHYSSTNKSLFDFYRALHDFLGRNQIDSIGPCRMRLEATSNNNWSLFIQGKTSRSDLNTSNQVGLGLASSTVPNSSHNFAEHETTWARTSLTLGSSSVYLTILS